MTKKNSTPQAMKKIKQSTSSSSSPSPSPPPFLSRTFSSDTADDRLSPCPSPCPCPSPSPSPSKDFHSIHTAPILSSNTILLSGFIAYVLSQVWPPLLLFVAFLLSRFIPHSFRVNDDGETRRRFWKEFVDNGNENKLDDLKKDPYYFSLPKGMKCEDVNLEESYWVNDRGMVLSTSIMTPKKSSKFPNNNNDKPLAVICYCHGFQGSSSLLARCEYQRFVHAGIAVISLDYEGHGRSDGRLGLVPSWEWLIDDTSRFFEEVCLGRFGGVPHFLSGESMGGAVAYSTYERNPNLWSGVLFVAPMCKIKEDMLPPQWVIDAIGAILGPSGTATLFSLLPLAPVSNKFDDYCFKEPAKRDLVHQAPYSFGGRKPRLATARELMNITSEISSSLHKFDAPFLVQHGKDDKITCPQLSEQLFQESPSKDKELKLYDGMWHTITSGEPDENIDLVFQDAIRWVLDRI